MAQKLAVEMATKLADTMPVRERSVARIEEAENKARRMQMELREKEEAMKMVRDECAMLRVQSRRRGASCGSKSPAPNSKTRQARSASRGALRDRACVVDPKPQTRSYEVIDSEVASVSEQKAKDLERPISETREIASALPRLRSRVRGLRCPGRRGATFWKREFLREMRPQRSQRK